MARKVLIGESSEAGNSPVCLLAGRPDAYGVIATGHDGTGFSSSFTGICEAHVALGCTAQPHFLADALETIEVDPALAAVSRDREVEIAAIRVAAYFGECFHLPRIENIRFPRHADFLLSHHLPYHKTRIAANTNGRRKTFTEKRPLFTLEIRDVGDHQRTTANTSLAVVSSADFLKL
jgi:hypothetical protein